MLFATIAREGQLSTLGSTLARSLAIFPANWLAPGGLCILDTSARHVHCGPAAAQRCVIWPHVGQPFVLTAPIKKFPPLAPDDVFFLALYLAGPQLLACLA